MEPLQIVLIVLAVAAIWAVIELAVTLRRARTTLTGVDKAVSEVNETIADTKPVITKLDGTLDDLQPAIKQIEPLLESTHVAVDALSANLVEVEAVVRDVSSLTGAAAHAGDTISSVTSSATDAVQRFLNRKRGGEADASLEGAKTPEQLSDTSVTDSDGAPEASSDNASADTASHKRTQYFTYDPSDSSEE